VSCCRVERQNLTAGFERGGEGEDRFGRAFRDEESATGGVWSLDDDRQAAALEIEIDLPVARDVRGRLAKNRGIQRTADPPFRIARYANTGFRPPAPGSRDPLESRVAVGRGFCVGRYQTSRCRHDRSTVGRPASRDGVDVAIIQGGLPPGFVGSVSAGSLGVAGTTA
jgi:hypothetical protein